MSHEDRQWLFFRAQQQHEAARLAIVQAEEAGAIAKIRLEEAAAILDRARAETIIYGPPRKIADKS